MIQHHPDDDLLLASAAGRLANGPSLLVAVHLESCQACRTQLRTLQAVGGAMLDDVEPQVLAPDALARTLERIEVPVREPAPPRTMAWPAPTLPGGAPWPRALRGTDITRWRWMAPGMHFARVRLRHDPGASVYLLQIAPGKSLARHSHSDLELTQVLSGKFEDGRATFAPGDFDCADGSVNHQPIVAPGDVCVCLASVEGRLRFDDRLVGVIGRLIGM